MLQQCKRRLKFVGLLNEARKTSFGIFLRSELFTVPFLFLTLIKYFFTWKHLAIQDEGTGNLCVDTKLILISARCPRTYNLFVHSLIIPTLNNVFPFTSKGF